MPRREGRFRTVSAGPPFGAVLLDLDGCLIASNDAHARAWSSALRLFGRAVPPSRIRWQVGKGGAELLRDIVSPAEHYFLAPAMGATQTHLFLVLFITAAALSQAGEPKGIESYFIRLPEDSTFLEGKPDKLLGSMRRDGTVDSKNGYLFHRGDGAR